MPSVHGSWTTSRKSHVHSSHTVHICALLVLPHNSQLRLSLPLCHSRCSCLFIQRLALRLSWTEKQSRSGRISMHPAGLLGRCVFGGAGLTVFSCGKHKHTVGHSVLVVQTHTNRLSHFSFFPPANFLHLLFFPFLLTFCTCFFFFFLPAPSFSQQSTVCSHF